jgi:hypothetical protein
MISRKEIDVIFLWRTATTAGIAAAEDARAHADRG